MTNLQETTTNKKIRDTLKSRLNDIVTELGSDFSTRSQYVKRSRDTGEYTVGMDERKLLPSQEVALDIFNSENGFTAWGIKGGFLQKATRPLIEPKIVYEDLPTLSDAEWKRCYVLRLKGVGGAFNGEDLEFQTSGISGFKTAHLIIVEASARLNEDYPDFMPIISLRSVEYMHKFRGRQNVAELAVVRWSTPEGVTSDIEVARKPTASSLSTPRS